MLRLNYTCMDSNVGLFRFMIFHTNLLFHYLFIVLSFFLFLCINVYFDINLAYASNILNKVD